MYGYQDVTPNAKDKKRRKQQEYQDGKCLNLRR